MKRPLMNILSVAMLLCLASAGLEARAQTVKYSYRSGDVYWLGNGDLYVLPPGGNWTLLNNRRNLHTALVETDGYIMSRHEDGYLYQLDSRMPGGGVLLNNANNLYSRLIQYRGYAFGLHIRENRWYAFRSFPSWVGDYLGHVGLSGHPHSVSSSEYDYAVFALN